MYFITRLHRLLHLYQIMREKETIEHMFEKCWSSFSQRVSGFDISCLYLHTMDMTKT